MFGLSYEFGKTGRLNLFISVAVVLFVAGFIWIREAIPFNLDPEYDLGGAVSLVSIESMAVWIACFCVVVAYCVKKRRAWPAFAFVTLHWIIAIKILAELMKITSKLGMQLVP